MNKDNKRIATCYTILFDKFFESGTVPENFNIPIIRPIIKDEKKHSNNKSDLRQMAVSDVSDICFEKAVANVFRKQCKTSPKKFGFKKRYTWVHAIFVLSQAIKYSKQLNKRVYLGAIDVSKAFDKVIRLILWCKQSSMFKKLRPTTINKGKKLKTFKTIILFTFIIIFFTVIFKLFTEWLS